MVSKNLENVAQRKVKRKPSHENVSPCDRTRVGEPGAYVHSVANPACRISVFPDRSFCGPQCPMARACARSRTLVDRWDAPTNGGAFRIPFRRNVEAPQEGHGTQTKPNRPFLLTGSTMRLAYAGTCLACATKMLAWTKRAAILIDQQLGSLHSGLLSLEESSVLATMLCHA